MKIERIEISHHQAPVDPPFEAAWDPEPRRLHPVTLLRVFDDEGRVGVASGDVPHGLEDYAHLFVGEDPRALDRHAEILRNVDLFAGRPWILEAALWDLVGAIRGVSVCEMVGGRARHVRAYASTGSLHGPEETAAFAAEVREAGLPALKLRFGRASRGEDFAVLAAVRAAVGGDLELMVDCNQGWRMPWDTTSAWEYAEAREVAQELARHGVFWMEEPLHRGDYAGMARLRADGAVRIAGGEYNRELHEFATLLERECLDVYQPDVVLTCGMTALVRLAAEVEARGCLFTPHTWGNGLGLVANLHLTAGAASAPFLELPWDPPAWTPAVRDYPLATPLEPDAQGRLHVPPGPGFGWALDEERLAATRTGGRSYA